MLTTWYHELNKLASLKPNVANLLVLVEETGDDLLFLHRVSEGGAHPRREAGRRVLGQLASKSLGYGD